MKFIIALILIVLSNSFIYSNDDTITIMHYNLMYYDSYTSYCTSSNNNVDTKDGYLATIVEYAKPDILTVNEVNASIGSVQRILVNALNINGITTYKRANFSGNYLANMLYYNSLKLELKSQKAISTSPRQTDIYNLYLKTNQLSIGDTIFLTCIVTHLKAGSTSSDANERALATQQIMNYIFSNNITGNILLLGDFNLYSSSEQAFINLTTIQSSGFKFMDPINQIGDWHDNYLYRNIHTQSTHTTSSGCHSTGGFDDRFDFILSSPQLFQTNNPLVYKKYYALGQDGLRFNGSLLSPSNISIPGGVANAIYGMSDHLPLVMKLCYTTTNSSISFEVKENITYNSPFIDQLTIKLNSELRIVKVYIISTIGVVVYSKPTNYRGEQEFSIPTGGYLPGVYLLCIQYIDGSSKTFKIVKGG